LCRKRQELALKTGQWYHAARGPAMQRKGSLVRQTSVGSDTDSRLTRESMAPRGAAKRSSSAHALMETDRMDDGQHPRMRQRHDSDWRRNGDVPRQRLRGEMEVTPFIIPTKTPAQKQYSDPKTKSNRDLTVAEKGSISDGLQKIGQGPSSHNLVTDRSHGDRSHTERGRMTPDRGRMTPDRGHGEGKSGSEHEEMRSEVLSPPDLVSILDGYCN